jgi:molybdopterin molybdotransferase
MVTIEEARAMILEAARPLPVEECPLSDSLGRSLAEDVVAGISVPPFDNSSMDGYAVVGGDTVRAGEDSPVRLVLLETIAAGHLPTLPIASGQATKIMTGAPLPHGADAVVEQEVTVAGEDHVLVFRSVAAGTNVRKAAEDLAAGDTVLSAGDPLGPAEIGILASLGVPRVRVHRLPRVAILATGSELVEVDQPIRTPGKIHNSNSYTAEAQCRQLGIRPVRMGIAPDDYAATRRLVEEGLSYDVLITSGGVSVGEFDFVKDVEDALGVERRLWQVAMKPGKPLVFGVKGDTLVFGVPGNPVASMVSFELFIRPALLRLMGFRRVLRPLFKARLEEDAPNRFGRVHVMRVRAWRDPCGWRVSSTGPQGSGILRSMVHANGLVFIPAEAEGMRVGDEVDLMLLREEAVEA